MKTFADEITCVGSCRFFVKTLSFVLLACVLTGFLSTAQAQYYFLPDLPVYWGPYPPRIIYSEPHELVPEDNYFYPRSLKKRRYSGVSIRFIEDQLAKQGYQLIAPVRRKGNRFLCVAADSEGHRQRFIYNVFTGNIVSRVSLGPNAGDRTEIHLNPIETQNPLKSANASLPKTVALDNMPKADKSSRPQNTGDLASSQANSTAPIQLKPSEPISLKPASEDPHQPQ